VTETVDEAPSACPSCPNCQSQYSYQVGDLKVCTECAHEWAVETFDAVAATDEPEQATSVIDDLRSKGSTLVGKLPTVVKKG
jgi:protein PhnA